MTTEIWVKHFIDKINIDESDIEGSDDLTIQGSDNDDTSKISNKKSELNENHIKMSNKKMHFKNQEEVFIMNG